MSQPKSISIAGQHPGQPQAAIISSPQQLRAALCDPSASHREPLGALLSASGKLSEVDLRNALAEQQDKPDFRIGEMLLSAGKIAADDLARALSLKFGIPYVRLGNFDIDSEVLSQIPQEVARGYQVLPLMRHQGSLVVAMRDPSHRDVLGVLSVLTRTPLEPVLATPSELAAAIATHYPPFDENELKSEAQRFGAASSRALTQPSAEKLAQEQPIVRLVGNMLHDAIQRRASDIHIRPREHEVEVLYRIDGSLIHIRNFSRALLPAVAARVKILGSMDIAEHRLPQDGAIHLSAAERSVDLRVSVIPCIHGENLVIRVLDRSLSLRRIADVGFSPADEKRFRDLINRNQGIVLVTGPTGSGKTTTLYAALQEINTGEYHIVTVEDPVEYRLDGIVQTQVHPVIEYDFSSALRHILRHDPDIILIGEIRDAQTARIALESALTGHLVLSTLHTNGATQTITRLLEMGVEPYLLSATLAGTLAQRLVRRNCEHCLQPETVDADIRGALGVNADETFFCGSGCTECSGTGYRGRVAVYEILQMTAAMRSAVRARAGDDELQALAVRGGMVPLADQALALARTGQISLQEVFRSRLD